MTLISSRMEATPFNLYKKKKTIVFWNDFVGPLTDSMLDVIRQNKIKIVAFGINFNSSIDKLPDCVNTITLKYRFQQPIYKLPSSLTTLNFGNYYPHSINCWPSSIQTIHIANNIHLLEYLPPYLQHLKINNLESNDINFHILPINLKSLNYECYNIDTFDDIFPPSMEILQFYKLKKRILHQEHLPITLKKIDYTK